MAQKVRGPTSQEGFSEKILRMSTRMWLMTPFLSHMNPQRRPTT